MKLQENTVLITGGASGIGFALAKRFVNAQSRVIICGRRRMQLEKARRELPELCTIECDLSSEAGRLSLFSRVTKKFPQFNVLINNAGVQNRPLPLFRPQNWEEHRQEIATNLDAPMHLSMMFITHLLKQPTAAIVNISSALAFAPESSLSTYSATKAALHSFTLSLRHQLMQTSVKVIEVIPEAVQTKLGGGWHEKGQPVSEFADGVMKRLERGDLEIRCQDTEVLAVL